MRVRRCLQPQDPPLHDDICHWQCLQYEALQNQLELLTLQQVLRDQLVLLLDAMRDQTRTMKDFAAALRGVPAG